MTTQPILSARRWLKANDPDALLAYDNALRALVELIPDLILRSNNHDDPKEMLAIHSQKDQMTNEFHR